MIELTLRFAAGERLWIAEDAPSAIQRLSRPVCVSVPGEVRRDIREYTLDEALSHLKVQTMGHHARSAYLGRDPEGWAYFAKGIGWCLVPGWDQSMGNTGILSRWGAERERDLSIELAGLGIPLPSPMAIYAYHEILATDRVREWTPADNVLDLDGRPSRPSLYIYRHRQRFRLADLPLLPVAQRDALRGQFWEIIRRVRAATVALQSAGGHDYSLGPHNVWLDGSRVDFEHVVVGGHPHPIEALNADVATWRAKEWYGMRCLAFELADLLGMELDAEVLIKATQPPA